MIDTDQVVNVRDHLKRDLAEMTEDHTKKRAVVVDVVQDLLLDAALDLPLVVVLDLLAVIKFILFFYFFCI